MLEVHPLRLEGPPSACSVAFAWLPRFLEDHSRLHCTVKDVDRLLLLQMRLLLDGSCVEVYLGSGEVLSTRIYRGEAPHGADAGIDLVSFGGSAKVVAVHAWEMSSIWQPERQKLLGLPGPGDAFEPVDILGAPVPA